jgi:hypothetical protein
MTSSDFGGCFGRPSGWDQFSDSTDSQVNPARLNQTGADVVLENTPNEATYSRHQATAEFLRRRKSSEK